MMRKVRPIFCLGPIALINLTRGHTAIIDVEDVHLIECWNWSAVESGRTWYAWRGGGGIPKVKLHNAVAGNGLWDHINRHGLDNRKCNLRSSTARQNTYNRRISIVNKSGFKGVSLLPSGKWIAQIQFGKNRTIGRFETALEAARAYDECALRDFGEFAYLNFPEAAE